MRLKGVVLALLLSAAASPLKAETPIIESFTLANGMEVVIIPNHRVPAVSHMLWFRAGAIDDPAGKSGLAHYHEHIMYQGTPRYGAGQYADMVAREGGQQNAFTGHDATAYYITIAKDKLPLAMSLEADRMRGLTPSNENVAKEKEIIIEERRERIENNPTALFAEQMAAALYRNHRYQIPVIGWMHEMRGLTKNDVLRFHRDWYRPNNAILVLSGDITEKEARPLVERYYGPLPKMPLPARTWGEEPPQNAARSLVMHHANVQQPVWSRIYAAPSLGYGDKDRALPLLVLSQLLGGGKTSALYRSLVVDKKLASSVDVAYDIFTLGPSEFEITVVPDADTKVETLDKVIDEELAAALKNGFDDKDMARAKTLLKAQSVYARDGITSMARIMGWIRIAGLDKDYFLRWPELIEAVTAKQVTEAAQAVFKPEQSVTGMLLPEKAGDKEEKE